MKAMMIQSAKPGKLILSDLRCKAAQMPMVDSDHLYLR